MEGRGREKRERVERGREGRDDRETGRHKWREQIFLEKCTYPQITTLFI
jgi:hypothetical protein